MMKMGVMLDVETFLHHELTYRLLTSSFEAHRYVTADDDDGCDVRR